MKKKCLLPFLLILSIVLILIQCGDEIAGFISPSPTPTLTSTNTPTETYTVTPSPSFTPSPTETNTPTFTITPSDTPTETPTWIPPTATRKPSSGGGSSCPAERQKPGGGCCPEGKIWMSCPTLPDGCSSSVWGCPPPQPTDYPD